MVSSKTKTKNAKKSHLQVSNRTKTKIFIITQIFSCLKALVFPCPRKPSRNFRRKSDEYVACVLAGKTSTLVGSFSSRGVA